MTRLSAIVLAALLTGILLSQGHEAPARAPTPPPPPPPYGEPIALEAARKVIAAAEVEAKKNNWPVAIAVVDGGGHLVAFARLDNTQYGSVEVSIQKAKTSALFRRPTKVFEEMLEKGGADLRILALPGATPLEGGLPIIVGGKLVGAVGVSGVKSTEDAQVAAAGLEALKAKWRSFQLAVGSQE